MFDDEQQMLLNIYANKKKELNSLYFEYNIINVIDSPTQEELIQEGILFTKIEKISEEMDGIFIRLKEEYNMTQVNVLEAIKTVSESIPSLT